MTDRYAVFGNPIAQSKSPLIHAQFAAQTGQDMSYESILAPVDGFAAAAQRFFDSGGRGCNVTMPFKLDAHELADELSEAAEAAGAVNTLMLMGDGRLYGHNTDGDGLVRDLLDNLTVALRGKRILLLGAGGASRGAILPLLQQQPTVLHIANRTADKASQLAAHFSANGPVTSSGFEALDGSSYDVVINGTPTGLNGETPPLPDTILATDGCGYDMVYSSEPTAFVRWLRARNAAIAADGRGMLVEQAASSFALWRGIRPQDTKTALSLIEQ